jgi:hypothetical protein
VPLNNLSNWVYLAFNEFRPENGSLEVAIITHSEN